MTTTLPRPLITAADLSSRLRLGSSLLVLDASFDLQDPQVGARAYAQGHIPGARYVHLDDDLCGPKTGSNGRHPLPARERFAATAGAWGITPQSDVVVYDAQGATFAAHLWWMLRWLGHERVAVLDGGLQAWSAAGGPLAQGPEAGLLRDGAAYPARASLVATVDAAELLSRLPHLAQAGGPVLVDARAPERYRGEVEPLDRVAGHIPGARNRFFKLNLDERGAFLPAAELQAAYGTLLEGRAPQQMIHQCGSGVTACHNLLAMAVAGLDGGVLYPGSWSEWCADPKRPVAKS